MSQENVDLVLRAMRAALKRPNPDFETVNALYHPDHVLIPVEARELGQDEAKGARGYKAWLEQTGDVLSWEGEAGGAVDVAPDTVLAVTTIRAHGVSSGAATEQRSWHVVTVTDGQITRTESYNDPAEALEAVGLSE
jgi:ketosteroid isomerase-like protein